MDFSKGVLFDPGYSKYTLAFSLNIDAAYNMIFSIKAFNQRKTKFKIIYPQLLKLFEQTVSFYLGCLLWATFISKNFANEPKEIIGNDYIGQEIDEEKMLYEVNYIISYFEKLKKDCKYYLGKECNLPQEWLTIMETYKEFLTMNDFLVNAKTTMDIKLPTTIKNVENQELETILLQIKDVVENGKLNKLFEVKNLIL
jgi:hypothetical protein